MRASKKSGALRESICAASAHLRRQAIFIGSTRHSLGQFPGALTCARNRLLTSSMLQLWLAAICPMSAPYLERRSAFSIRKKDQLSFSLFHSLSPNFSAWRACNKRIAVKSQYGSSFSRGSLGCAAVSEASASFQTSVLRTASCPPS